MNMEKNEHRIYLKDLLFVALYGWKKVVIAAVVLSLALGVYGIVAGAESTADNELYQLALQEYETKLAVLEQQEQITVQSIEAQEEYLENSVLMRLDPFRYYTATLRMYVETAYQIQPNLSYQDPDKTASVLDAYHHALLGGPSLEAIAQTLETKSQYVSELVEVTLPINTANICISVKCASQESAEAILKVLMRQMLDAAPQIKTAITEHTVTVLEETVQECTSQDLANIQKEADTLQDQLVQSRTKIVQERSALARPSLPDKKNEILFVLGAVLGAFLVVCVAWVLHIVGSKVYSVRTLQDRTGLKVLGTVRAKDYKGSEAWLRRVEGRNMSDSMERVLADVCCRTKGAKRVLVVGSADTALLAEALQQRLPGVTVEQGDILTDAAAFQALVACDCVVVVEQCGVSGYEQINRRMSMINDYNKPVAGCVLLDG